MRSTNDLSFFNDYFATQIYDRKIKQQYYDFENHRYIIEILGGDFDYSQFIKTKYYENHPN